jgi:opacity protein-like surface antigen
LSLIFPIKSVSICCVAIQLRFFLPALALLLGCGLAVGQPTSQGLSSERDYRFRMMQQRMLELSEKMGRISGTEPIQLIDRNQSLALPPPKSEAQKSYEQLPGPPVEPLPMPVENQWKEESVTYQSEVSSIAPTNQQIRGDYYFMPMIGLALTSYTTYTFEESQSKFRDKLNGELGNSVALTGGRRWENLLAYIRFGYQHQRFENANFSSGLGTNYAVANGSEESYSLSVGGGYSVALNDTISTIGTLGIGSAFRRNSFDSEVVNDGKSYTPPIYHSDFQSSMVFTYDLAIGLEIMLAENFTSYLGYRLIGLTDNKDFEGSFQHLFELGVGANF